MNKRVGFTERRRIYILENFFVSIKKQKGSDLGGGNVIPKTTRYYARYPYRISYLWPPLLLTDNTRKCNRSVSPDTDRRHKETRSIMQTHKDLE